MEWDGDRRDGRRFEMQQQVRYCAAIGRRKVQGSGHTLNMSSSGILFSGDKPLPENAWVTVEVSWPVLLDRRTPIKLVTRGRVVRVEKGCMAVRIREWEFRTAAASNTCEPPSAPHGGDYASKAAV